MAKTATIKLGGETYTVQAFTLDDIEEISGILGEGADKQGATIKLLKVALRNAQPPLSGEAGKIRIDSLEELRAATNEILKLAGIEVKENPTLAAAEPTAA